jgi:hypothetical protein
MSMLQGFGAGSIFGKQNCFIVLRAMEHVQNLDGVGDDPIEDQIIPIRAAAHAATLVSGNQRKGLRHGAELLAAKLKLGHEGFGSPRIVDMLLFLHSSKNAYRRPASPASKAFSRA